MVRKLTGLLILSCALPQFACAAPVSIDEAETNKAPQMAEEKDEARQAVNLPYARGHHFESLDEYLAYLKQYNGPIDLPWWREISPGVYRHEVRMAGGSAPETATRAELEERFGFGTAD